MKPILDYPAEEFQQQVRVMRRAAGFVEPPVPVTAAHTYCGQLLEPGKAQRNCVGGYTSRVADGKFFVCRVLKPLETTLLRMVADGGWKIDQLLLACDQPFLMVTGQAVRVCLANESFSI